MTVDTSRYKTDSTGRFSNIYHHLKFSAWVTLVVFKSVFIYVNKRENTLKYKSLVLSLPFLLELFLFSNK